MYELLSYSRFNAGLSLIEDSDVSTLFQGEDTNADTLFEYAARLCYGSTSKLGDSPNFIAQRLKEGHEDVIEHGTFTFQMPAGEAITLPFINRHVIVTPHWKENRLDLTEDWLVSGNARVWLHLFRSGYALPLLPTLTALAPKTFAEFNVVPVNLARPRYEPTYTILQAGDSVHRVLLLSANLPGLKPDYLKEHGSATFLIEHVSRTLTHQLVRARLGSYSQASQRYISLEKGGWQAIYPPAISADPESRSITENFYRIAEDTYAVLRARGIRKEDARFLLPGATESRLVMSMSFAGWDNFCYQRLPKAAQWEIRDLAVTMHGMLRQIAPTVFKSLDEYQKG